MMRRVPLALALIAGVLPLHAADVSSSQGSSRQDVVQQVEQWRAQRLAGLTAPDGWLSLIGLEWLRAGDNRVGSAADNDVVLAAGPAHLGVVHVGDDGAVGIQLAPGSGATVDGKDVAQAPLIDDMHATGDAAPTTVRFGTASFYVIDRDGRKALRVKDANAATRTGFRGIESFPIDPQWRIEAQWVPFVPPEKLEIGSVIGTIDAVDVPGKAVFQRDGRTFELRPYQEEPGGELFFVIADRTSGKETYGAARFFYAALPAGGVTRPGTVVLDFNRAYNPPCAFTPFATCPLAPPENRLDIAVTAGEKKYGEGHH
ncbi:DUF1684 domain-containing protein [Dyella sp.]|jgi:uncharacterized protein (DUF1684 family)|uniref:DUF1684 domain-containing protein n=1 Tax=Dyella sp. TaxID=1869338 RepID=UPI002D795378|nr:DUF1684 domain-containing protein [Dyella sp.]HET6433034.1 DUF1684 domain-containing protein [Dyella sp.]